MNYLECDSFLGIYGNKCGQTSMGQQNALAKGRSKKAVPNLTAYMVTFCIKDEQTGVGNQNAPAKKATPKGDSKKGSYGEHRSATNLAQPLLKVGLVKKEIRRK